MTDGWESDVDEALRTLRADVPEMDPRTFAAGRARLLAHIGEAPPTAAELPPGDPAAITPPTDRRRSPPLRRAAPWLGVAAAVAAVAVGAVALLAGSGQAPVGGTPTAASPEPGPTAPTGPPANTTGRGVPPTGRPGEPLPPMPAAPLNPAGDLAPKVSELTVPPGQVLYVKSARRQASGDTDPDGTDIEELWIPADRDGVWLQRRTANGNIQGRSDKGFEESRAAGGRFDGHVPQSRWAVTPDKMAALPRDPAALYELLRAEVNADLPPGTGTSVSSPQRAVETLIGLLADHTNGVPPDLRAAVLRTLGYLPDVTLTPNATATDGRPAVALGWIPDDSGSYRNELLLAPSTARIVEWRNVAIVAFNGFQPGEAFTSQLVTEAIVPKPGQRP